MSALLQISIKGNDGKYKNYTVSISDEPNKYGQNVSMWVEQTKEERESKANKKYIGNGKVVWTDGKITKPEKIEKAEVIEDSNSDDLPF